MAKKKKRLLSPSLLRAMEEAIAFYIGGKVNQSDFDHVQFTLPVYVRDGAHLYFTKNRNNMPQLLKGSPILHWVEIEHRKLNDIDWMVFELTGKIGRTSTKNKKDIEL